MAFVGRLAITCASVLLACGADDAPTSGSGSGSGSASSSSATGSDSAPSSESGSESDSQSGSGGVEARCEVIDPVNTPSSGSQPDPTVRRTVVGENGEFTDVCDVADNLTEYVCETLVECGPGPNPGCTTRQSGLVVEQAFDCAGTCDSGTCITRCPAIGDIVEYTAVEGDSASLLNQGDDRMYACDLIFDQATDDYDCSADPLVGGTTTVSSLGLMSTWCTGAQAFNVGTGEPQQCTYLCAAEI